MTPDLKTPKRKYRSDLEKDRKDVLEGEMELLVDLLVFLRVVGYTPSQCAAVVNLSKSQVKKICGEEDFKRRVTLAKKSLPAAARKMGEAYLIEAVQVNVAVMRNNLGKRDEITMKAVESLYDRFGLPKLSRSESTVEEKPKEGVGISIMERLREAPPEVQERAAALQEAFEHGLEQVLTEGGDSDA